MAESYDNIMPLTVTDHVQQTQRWVTLLALLPSDVTVFAVLAAHGLLAGTVSLLDVM